MDDDGGPRGGGTAVARIAAALREEILLGRAAPGQALREEALAERFGASRHTVRTALARLGATGLVRSEPYRGTAVTSFDVEQAVALQDLRRALECEAVEVLVRRHPDGWPPEVLAPLEARVAELAAAERATGGRAADPRAPGEDDAAAWRAVERAHSALHRALVAAAGSPRITAAHEQIADEMDLLLLHARHVYRPGELAAQHAALLADLPVRGAAAVREHLDDTVVRLAAGAGGGPGRA
jgi:DNA-binding GntR family transcriptional regulator